MPKGVPARVQVLGRPRTYTFTEIAEGTGLSLSLISRVLRGQRSLTEYAQARLAEFFEITVEQLRTPGMVTQKPRPVYRPRRVVARARHGSLYRPPLRTWEAAVREAEAMNAEPFVWTPPSSEDQEH